MDDKTTNTCAWLALTLTFDASARLCGHLRGEGYSPAQIAELITTYRQNHSGESTTGALPASALHEALKHASSTEQLASLRSAKTQEKISASLEWSLSTPRHHLLGLDHPDYPALLLDTSNPAPLLYAKGDLAALDCPAVAIVGSRKASRAAIELTNRLAASLAQRGIAIVSGLAGGIDAAAHEGALAVGGRTIAVAATEPESVYPKRHAGLQKRIIEQGGLIMTEYPLGAPTLRWYFPRRNRIISGISLGVVVAEAALPSGTLTTAAHAADQGREVMAVPGSVLNPQAKGCHALIKQGAALVESEQDILEVLALTSLEKRQIRELDNGMSRNEMDFQDPTAALAEDPLQKLVMSVLSVAPASVDELMTHMEYSFAEISTKLGLMEIEGVIKACSGGRYTRC